MAKTKVNTSIIPIWDYLDAEVYGLKQDRGSLHPNSLSLYALDEKYEEFPTGSAILKECHGSRTVYYLLTDDDAAIALEDPEQYIAQRATEWAKSDAESINANEYSFMFNMLSWGVSKPRDYEVADDYTGSVAILATLDDGSEPIRQMITKDHSLDTLVFDCRDEALGLINDALDECYNSGFEPAEFTIVEAK